MTKIIVEDTSITVLKIDDKAFISLTDMLRAKDGDFYLILATKPQYLSSLEFGNRYTTKF